MSQFPKINPEKCPYCGKQLNLVETKYVWDYYYECEGCHRKYTFKNSQPPNIRDVYDTQDYKKYQSWKQQEQESKSVTPFNFAATTPQGGTFVPYICKQFQDISNYRGQSSSAIDELQTYLNTHRITRDRIVSLNTAAYGGIVVITLVYT